MRRAFCDRCDTPVKFPDNRTIYGLEQSIDVTVRNSGHTNGLDLCPKCLADVLEDAIKSLRGPQPTYS